MHTNYGRFTKFCGVTHVSIGVSVRKVQHFIKYRNTSIYYVTISTFENVFYVFKILLEKKN